MITKVEIFLIFKTADLCMNINLAKWTMLLLFESLIMKKMINNYYFDFGNLLVTCLSGVANELKV